MRTRPLVVAAAAVIAGATLIWMVTAGPRDEARPGAGGEASGHAHDGQAAAAPRPYDPTKPVDLGGVPGVTPEQQARAEALVTSTLEQLPFYADPATAELHGYRWVGDRAPEMHYINWSYINDGRILDPAYPESLVYEYRGGEPVLVAAMFMLSDADTLDTAPDIGGPLTQWHVHADLCFTDDPVAAQLAGVTSADGECTPPLAKRAAMPMIHVWIVPHECGPFASLSGIGGGQIPEGEQRLCDHAHGSRGLL